MLVCSVSNQVRTENFFVKKGGFACCALYSSIKTMRPSIVETIMNYLFSNYYVFFLRDRRTPRISVSGIYDT
jgi:hypothetical protein